MAMLEAANDQHSEDDEAGAGVGAMIGPYRVRQTDETLTLRRENRGEVTVKALLLFAFTMMFILIIGVLSVIQTADTGMNAPPIDDPQNLFAPTRNHFGFLWLTASLAMLVFVPLYLAHIYRSALIFAFDRTDNSFTKSGKLITRLGKIEYISLREARDPDGAYLYILSILHGDGYETTLYNGYEERAAMNLANEISAFIHRPVRWKQ